MPDLTNRVIANARKRGVKVYTHRQWGGVASVLKYRSRLKSHPHSLLPTESVGTVWQHITVTNDTGKTAKSFKADMRTLERIGDERFGTGVSYNVGWDMVTGEIGIGQFLEVSGAHTLNDKKIPGYSYNQNKVAIAIAAIGMPGTIPTQKAGDALVQFLAALIEEGAVAREFDYVPHSLVANKDCPTEPVRKIMPGIQRQALKYSAVAEAPAPVLAKRKAPSFRFLFKFWLRNRNK